MDGVISEVGSYNSLRASRGAFSEFLDTYAKEQTRQTDADSGTETFVCAPLNDFYTDRNAIKMCTKVIIFLPFFIMLKLHTDINAINYLL